MDRDNKGRFKKPEDEERVPNLLERAPSLKVMIIIIIIGWITSGLIPRPGAMRNNACQLVCFQGQDEGSDGKSTYSKDSSNSEGKSTHSAENLSKCGGSGSSNFDIK